MVILSEQPLLKLNELAVEFYPNRSQRSFYAVCQVNLELERGEVIGLVGESGCGKSLTGRALLGLLPPTARPTGKLEFDGRQYLIGSPAQAQLRGRRIGMIFQEPTSALNPVYTVGDQLRETLYCLRGLKGEENRAVGLQLLRRVELPEPEKIIQQYPHQLSGGQQQRVLIALALAGEPELLIADEPATALDAPLRRKIIELLEELAGAGLSVLFISHDLSLIREVCERSLVMYSGYSVEDCSFDSEAKLDHHPYTQGLLATADALTAAGSGRLPVIEGEVPSPKSRPSGCPFSPRCGEKLDQCDRQFPPAVSRGPGFLHCWAREAEK